jgi:hypothetical protein
VRRFSMSPICVIEEVKHYLNYYCLEAALALDTL